MRCQPAAWADEGCFEPSETLASPSVCIDATAAIAALYTDNHDVNDPAPVDPLLPDSSSGQTQYEFVLKGRLGSRLLRALEGLEVTSASTAETRLRGWLADQSALHGILERIRDLGIELVDVHRVP